VRRAQRPAAAFLLAFSGLLAELAWTRIAGLLFFGESAFLVVSWAVAGLSLGAALGAVRPAWLRLPASSVASGVAGAASAAGLAVVLLAAGRGGVGLALAAIVPGFTAFGLALAGVFAGDARHAPRIYAADLAGAALGAVATLPALSVLGAPDALLLAAAGAAAAGVVAAPTAGRRAYLGTVALALALLVAAPGPDADPARWATPKSIVAELDRGGQRLASRWGSVGRSDLVRRADGAEVLYLDGGAGSLVPTPASARLWRGDLGRFAFEVLRPERVFVVGGGAGLEVAHALETGAHEVVVAEVNRAGADLARERLAAARGDAASGGGAADPADPFGDPRVRWVGDEARAVLRASDGAYDLITLSQAVTRTAEARGLALTENGIYTVEATRDWLAALAPGGAVAYELYDELTLTRALTTVGTALVEMGAAPDDAAALDRLVMLLDPATAPPTPLLLAFRDAPDRGAVVTIARAAEARGLALLHLPGLLENPPLNAVAGGSASLASLVAASTEVDVAPTRDDAPFFWSFEPRLPASLQRAVTGLGVAALLTGSALILLWSRRAAPPPGTRRGLTLAALLGVSFLGLEMALLSRAGLLLGHPAAALATTLGALLAGAGIGAVRTRRRPDAWRSVSVAAGAAGLATAAWTAAWPPVAAAVAGEQAIVRTVATVALLTPLGVALGAPFPLLLRRLGASAVGPGTIARAWALNGAGSLLGGVGAIAVAHLAGFRTVSLIAVAGYVAVSIIAFAMHDRGEGR